MMSHCHELAVPIVMTSTRNQNKTKLFLFAGPKVTQNWPTKKKSFKGLDSYLVTLCQSNKTQICYYIDNKVKRFFLNIAMSI